jgi:hypothetical protein
MDIWNYTTSTWENTQNLTATSWIQNNVTLTSNHISGGLVKTIFTDQTPLGTTQGNIGIDYQRIHGITTGTPSVYRLNITTNTTDIPQTSNHTLQLRYNVSRDNFTLQLWNGSSWNNRTTLNDTSLSYRNVTLFSNELILYSNAGGINKYYTLVRYLDVNASATQQGAFYLDYQRIYNS